MECFNALVADGSWDGVTAVRKKTNAGIIAVIAGVPSRATNAQQYFAKMANQIQKAHVSVVELVCGDDPGELVEQAVEDELEHRRYKRNQLIAEKAEKKRLSNMSAKERKRYLAEQNRIALLSLNGILSRDVQ